MSTVLNYIRFFEGNREADVAPMKMGLTPLQCGINYRYSVVQQGSRTYSSCITETLYLWNNRLFTLCFSQFDYTIVYRIFMYLHLNESGDKGLQYHIPAAIVSDSQPHEPPFLNEITSI